VEASSADAQTGLFDEHLNELPVVRPLGGPHRLDWPAAAGQTFYVRLSGTSDSAGVKIADLVRLEGTSVFVSGTANGDQFVFDASGAVRRVTVNGVVYAFEAADATSFDFDGDDGDDDAQLIGSTGVDTAELHPRRAMLNGDDYTVTAVNVESSSFDGGGGKDNVFLHGGPGADSFTAGGEGPASDPRQATLTGNGISLAAIAEVVYAYGHGGQNTAYLYESGGDNVFQPFWQWAQMWGDPDPEVDGDEYFRQVRGFKDISVLAAQGSDEFGLRERSNTVQLSQVSPARAVTKSSDGATELVYRAAPVISIGIEVEGGQVRNGQHPQLNEQPAPKVLHGNASRSPSAVDRPLPSATPRPAWFAALADLAEELQSRLDSATPGRLADHQSSAGGKTNLPADWYLQTLDRALEQLSFHRS
jgi:hypothetical protein